MHVSHYLPVVAVLLLISSIPLLLWSVGGVNIDVEVTVASFYVVFMILVVEGMVYIVPERVVKALSTSPTLTLLPGFLLIFFVGFKYGDALKFEQHLETFISSVALGVVSAIFIMILSNLLTSPPGDDG